MLPRFYAYGNLFLLCHKSNRATIERINLKFLIQFNMKKTDFMDALSREDLHAIRSAPKTDVHSHAFLSTRIENLEQWLGHSVTRPPQKMNGLEDMMAYVINVLAPLQKSREGFEFVSTSGVKDAIEDGVVHLEMSFDIMMTRFYPDGLTEVKMFIEALVDTHQPNINLRPELGIPRTHVGDAKLMKMAYEALELGVFQSIDLYSFQDACDPEEIKPLYNVARAVGMKRKAHVGEFGGAEEIRRTVEILDLDEVQHGIAAVESVEVMQWLAQNQIQLNVCPTSNVMLSAVPDLNTHPIRILFDRGVPVTINTDDLIIFGQSVSEEYLNLYKTGVFSARELDDIRVSSLTESELGLNK